MDRNARRARLFDIEKRRHSTFSSVLPREFFIAECCRLFSSGDDSPRSTQLLEEIAASLWEALSNDGRDLIGSPETWIPNSRSAGLGQPQRWVPEDIESTRASLGFDGDTGAAELYLATITMSALDFTDRERAIAASYFESGLQLGSMKGLMFDEFRGAASHAKRGRALSVGNRNKNTYIPVGKVAAVGAVLAAHLSAPAGEALSLDELGFRIQQACGVGKAPGRSSVKRWLRAYRKTGNIHGE